MDSRLAKAAGCLAGLALGDAMGMPVEFMTPAQIAAAYGRIEGLVASPAWHPHVALPAGSITDDTGQALALASVYRSSELGLSKVEGGALSKVEGTRMTAGAAGRALLAWADRSESSAMRHWTAEQIDMVMGPSTRQALEAMRSGVNPRESGRAGKTNGGAMRIAPVAVVRSAPSKRPVLMEEVVEACLPTHGTTLAISGAAAVAFAVAEAMQPAPTLDTIVESAMEGAVRGRNVQAAWAWTPPIEKRIRFAVDLVLGASSEALALEALFDLVGVDMPVAESVPAVFGLVALAGGDPMLAIRYAVNLGGDADTIASMAGAICGAWRGLGALDAGLLAEVERVNHLDIFKVARDLAQAGGEIR